MRVTFSNKYKDLARNLLSENHKEDAAAIRDLAEIDKMVETLFSHQSMGAVTKELYDAADALDSRVKIAYQEIEDLYRALYDKQPGEATAAVVSNKKEVDYVVDGFWVDVYGIDAQVLAGHGVLSSAAEMIEGVEET